LSCDCDNEKIQNVKPTLTNNDWLIISHDLTEALLHIHSKGLLHCDLKSNNVLVTKKGGFIIDFGKACDSSFPTTKRYNVLSLARPLFTCYSEILYLTVSRFHINNIQATILAENMSINPKSVNSAISPVQKSEIECKTVKLSAKL